MAYLFASANSQYYHLGSSLGVSIPFCASALIKPASLPGSPVGIVAFDHPAWNNGCGFLIESGGPIRAIHSEAVFAKTSTSLSAGSWGYIAGSWNSNTSRDVWLNGAGKGSNTTSHTTFDQTDFYIGAIVFSYGTQYFNGTIQQVYVWSGSMTDAEAAAIAAGRHPLVVKPYNLIDGWELDTRLISWKGRSTLTAVGSPSSVANRPGGMGRFPPTTGRRPTPIPPVDVTVQSLENVSVIAPGEVNSGASIVVSNVSQAQTLSVPFVAPDSILSVDNAVNAQTLSEPQVLPFTGITVHKVYNAQTLSSPIIVPAISGDEFTNFDGSFHTDSSRRVVRWGASPDGNVAGRVYRAPIGYVVRSVQFVGAATGGTLDFVGGNADDAEGVSLLAAPLTEAGITTLIVGRAAWYAPVMTDMAGIECYLFFERE